MIICKTGPGLEYTHATCSPGKWNTDDLTVDTHGYVERAHNWDYDNVTWQRQGQEIMILPPYEFCPEVCIHAIDQYPTGEADPKRK